MDVDTAFLNADINEDIWVEIPEGTKIVAANNDGNNKLQKSTYGLKKQAFRNWNNDNNQYIIDNDFTRSETDPCKYVKKIEINNNGIITIYITQKQYIESTVS